MKTLLLKLNSVILFTNIFFTFFSFRFSLWFELISVQLWPTDLIVVLISNCYFNGFNWLYNLSMGCDTRTKEFIDIYLLSFIHSPKKVLVLISVEYSQAALETSCFFVGDVDIVSVQVFNECL